MVSVEPYLGYSVQTLEFMDVPGKQQLDKLKFYLPVKVQDEGFFAFKVIPFSRKRWNTSFKSIRC